MDKEQKTWTLDDSALASNPGGISVDVLCWIRHYPKWPMIFLGALVLGVVLANWLHASMWLLVGLVLVKGWLYWQRVSEHFKYGCITPAVVISSNPLIIAVSTDLTKGSDEYPAIKIIEVSIGLVNGEAPKIGKKLVVISLYGGSDDLPYWEDFDPQLIDCATNDADIIQAAMESIEDYEWQDLKSGLKQVPRPLECGLFYV